MFANNRRGLSNLNGGYITRAYLLGLPIDQAREEAERGYANNPPDATQHDEPEVVQIDLIGWVMIFSWWVAGATGGKTGILIHGQINSSVIDENRGVGASLVLLVP